MGGDTRTGSGVPVALSFSLQSLNIPDSAIFINTATDTPYYLKAGVVTTLIAATASAVAVGGITGLGTGVATALAINVGSAGAPVVLGGALGTPSSGTLTSVTGLPVGTGISGLGTGVATALAVNVGSSGAFVTLDGALGTPSSGIGTNITNVNAATLGGATFAAPGTIGGGTPAAGHFTTLSATGAVTVGTGADAADFIGNGFSGSTKNGVGVQDTTDTADVAFIAFRKASGARIGYISRNSTTDAVVYNLTSDATLKNIIGDSDPVAATKRLMAYRMRDYEWKSTPGLLRRGPIAQETYVVNKLLATPGFDLHGEHVPWSVDMDGFIPDLVMSLQLLRTEFNAYKVSHP